MSRKMLIDAAHADEIRVAIVKDNVLEEIDYQISQKKSTKGNIYLAKVTRVEPSLQAAFVEYGGNRHGFLPFSEIHPDYYQIPVSDREKLLEEIRQQRYQSEGKPAPKRKSHAQDEEESLGNQVDDVEGMISSDAIEPEEEQVESIHASESDQQEDENYRPDFYKRYKIQEVVKKDQVILVQIEKEERGNKGAALTTYISIAGRYCVYMPNATKGGGVSRKINDASDRDRLKQVARELTDELGGNGAIIIRTAGAFKTKAEIKRDSGYLQKLWDNIRDHTMKSKAPTFIHEEGDVVKKAVRDMYDPEIDEIVIQGDKSFDEAKEFMQMILPKHISKLKKHDHAMPIFSKYDVESQVAELYSTQVYLRSGGYIVINQTEALVSIDINSGKSTSERNVEGTAYRTNLEAAREIARQLRLRDLSGLIVIDFIDMEDNKNKKSVEKALKEALAIDKAKIQIGRISHFGLLEMSRQRIKQSFLESNTQVCEHCQGRGRIRQIEASSLAVIRAIENEVTPDTGELIVSAGHELVTYLLNNKRSELAELDRRFRARILFAFDETAGGDGFFISKSRLPKDSGAKEALSKIDDASLVSEQPSDDGQSELTNGRERGRNKRRRNRRDRDNREPRDDAQEQNFQELFEESELEDRSEKPAHKPAHQHKKAKIETAAVDEEFTPGNSVDEDSSERPQRSGKQRWKRREDGRRDDNRRDDRPRNHEMHGNEDGQNERGNKRRDRHKKRFNEKDAGNNRADDAEMKEEREFDTEMAARRKANQSLLKEIWKKIVD